MRTGSSGRILVHTADPPLTLVLRHIGDVHTADLDGPLINRNASADDIQHGSLTRAIASDHRHELSVLDGQIEIPEQAHLIDRTRIVIFVDMV